MIRNAVTGDVDAAVAALGEAFADDPLMLHLFHDHPRGVCDGVTRFFSILLRVRLALGAPALVLEQGGEVLGAAMGYDTSRPEWPASFTEEWRQFEADVPGFAARMPAYEHISDAHQPGEPHHYLGVLGVRPSLQGKGAGKALLEAFCAPSQADTASHGVYLDTTNPRSLQFYYANGFELRGEGSLGDAHVWCVFKPSRHVS